MTLAEQISDRSDICRHFMFKDLARELEQTTGRVNISELSREAGYFLCKPDGTYFVDVTVLFRLLKRMDLTGYGRFFFKRTDLERQCQRALRRAVQKKIIKLTWLIKPRKNEGDLNSYSIFFVSRQKKLELFRNLANAKKKISGKIPLQNSKTVLHQPSHPIYILIPMDISVNPRLITIYLIV